MSWLIYTTHHSKLLSCIFRPESLPGQKQAENKIQRKRERASVTATQHSRKRGRGRVTAQKAAREPPQHLSQSTPPSAVHQAPESTRQPALAGPLKTTQYGVAKENRSPADTLKELPVAPAITALCARPRDSERLGARETATAEGSLSSACRRVLHSFTPLESGKTRACAADAAISAQKTMQCAKDIFQGECVRNLCSVWTTVLNQSTRRSELPGSDLARTSDGLNLTWDDQFWTKPHKTCPLLSPLSSACPAVPHDRGISCNKRRHASDTSAKR